MKNSAQPSKERIRQWTKDRQRNRAPLPTIEQIKLQLGWRSDDKHGVIRSTPIVLDD